MSIAAVAICISRIFGEACMQGMGASVSPNRRAIVVAMVAAGDVANAQASCMLPEADHIAGMHVRVWNSKRLHASPKPEQAAQRSTVAT